MDSYTPNKGYTYTVIFYYQQHLFMIVTCFYYLKLCIQALLIHSSVLFILWNVETAENSCFVIDYLYVQRLLQIRQWDRLWLHACALVCGSVYIYKCIHTPLYIHILCILLCMNICLFSFLSTSHWYVSCMQTLILIQFTIHILVVCICLYINSFKGKL